MKCVLKSFAGAPVDARRGNYRQVMTMRSKSEPGARAAIKVIKRGGVYPSL